MVEEPPGGVKATTADRSRGGGTCAVAVFAPESGCGDEVVARGVTNVMSADTKVVAAEWQPSLACFCPSCKLHVNILRVPVQAGSVRDVSLTVGAAHEGELVSLACPNCKTMITVSAVKPGGPVRLAQLLGEGSVEPNA
jgi:hypothetical protein